jgi:uncharacterized protein (TIGR03435 family)
MPPDRNGFPQLPAAMSGMMVATSYGLNQMTARGMPLSALTNQLGAQLGTITGPNTFAMGRIVDKTGLTGKYDLHLEYAGGGSMIGGALTLPAGPDGEPSSGQTIIDAMEKQLGLKLTKSTSPADVLVIDHVERIPTEN